MTSTPPTPLAPLYDQSYYAQHCGEAYVRSDHWAKFFGAVAERIVTTVSPKTTLDAGCAHGFLVEALVDRGVDAYGIDISEFAISQVRDDIRDRCRVHSILEPFGRKYDLITCTEVLEHLEPAEVLVAVANLCAHSDDIIFGSTPLDYREETHVNVHPPEHWVELFAEHDFVRDVDFDASFIAPWAVRFRRRRDPVARTLGGYERSLWHLMHEASERNQVVLCQMQEINNLHQQVQELQAAVQECGYLSETLSGTQNLLVSMEATIREQRLTLDALRANPALKLATQMNHSVGIATLKLATKMKHSVGIAAPQDTRRRRMLRHAVILLVEGKKGLRPRRAAQETQAAAAKADYKRWLELHEPSGAQFGAMRLLSASWPYRPLVSVLVPTYNPAAGWLEEMVASVLGQIYTNWELCIGDDGSNSQMHSALEAYAASDPRIKVTFSQHNGGIVAASNAALGLATGEFVTFLDHDDVLRPHALHELVQYLQGHPDTDMVYSDEDKLLTSGERGDPSFKPDWSPEMLLGWNYICHIPMIRSCIVEEVGGFREGFDGSQDHDLLLRAGEKARHVGHVPLVLYDWRQVPGSVALDGAAKPYAREAGRKAVEDAVARRGREATVSHGLHPGYYAVRYRLTASPSVAIIIPTRDRGEMLRTCIESVVRTSTYTNYTITVVDNDSQDPATLEYLASLDHTVIRHAGHFNYSRLINTAAHQVDADYYLTLNNDMSVITPDWIEAMLEHGQHDEVAVVGARLLYPDGRVQHEGVGLGLGYIAANIEYGHPTSRNVTAVTGACMLVRAKDFWFVDGFDEQMPVAYNDVDFCLRLRQKGRSIIFTPFAELTHHESASRGKLDPKHDHRIFCERWGRVENLRDPFVSPHLLNVKPPVIRVS